MAVIRGGRAVQSKKDKTDKLLLTLYGMEGDFTATELARGAGNSDWRRLASYLLRERAHTGEVLVKSNIRPYLYRLPDDGSD